MKNSILFLLLLSLFACGKEDAFELMEVTEPKEQDLTKGGFGTSPPTGCPVGDPTSLFRLSPYVEQAAPCYNLYHSGYEYETVVYVLGWRNGSRSSIPNTYSLTIPGHTYVSNRLNTWVPDEDYKATCAEVQVQNCYYERLPCHLTNSCDDDDDDEDEVPTIF